MSSSNPGQSVLALFGRIFIAVIFVIAGFNKIVNFSDVASTIASQGLPYSQLFTIGAIICELGGGLMLIFGFYARFGALLLIIFVVITTFVFHAFWTFEGQVMTNQMHHFMKNVAMVGGLLYVIGYGAGGLSLTRGNSQSAEG